MLVHLANLEQEVVVDGGGNLEDLPATKHTTLKVVAVAVAAAALQVMQEEVVTLVLQVHLLQSIVLLYLREVHTLFQLLHLEGKLIFHGTPNEKRT
jgi:hypothetical protein